MPVYYTMLWKFKPKSLWTYSNGALMWALDTTVVRSTRNTADIWGEQYICAPVLAISPFLCKNIEQ